jgi:hypothetical protein
LTAGDTEAIGAIVYPLHGGLDRFDFPMTFSVKTV